MRGQRPKPLDDSAFREPAVAKAVRDAAAKVGQDSADASAVQSKKRRSEVIALTDHCDDMDECVTLSGVKEVRWRIGFVVGHAPDRCRFRAPTHFSRERIS